jgi:hypothetical protein
VGEGTHKAKPRPWGLPHGELLFDDMVVLGDVCPLPAAPEGSFRSFLLGPLPAGLVAGLTAKLAPVRAKVRHAVPA